jgi:hypothetical protein
MITHVSKQTLLLSLSILITLQAINDLHPTRWKDFCASRLPWSSTSRDFLNVFPRSEF